MGFRAGDEATGLGKPARQGSLSAAAKELLKGKLKWPKGHYEGTRGITADEGLEATKKAVNKIL